jgi:FdhD protein
MAGLRDVPAHWLTSEGITKGMDIVCHESALSISISDGLGFVFPLGMTMRTPGMDKELVIGLLFSEGIIDDFSQISEIQILNDDILVMIPSLDEKNMSEFQRRISSTSSCGVCGKDSISNLLHIHGPELSEDVLIKSSVINDSIEDLRKKQSIFQKTGGAHASGLFDVNGKLLFIAEDIGRHNAMDKLVGSIMSESPEIFSKSFILFSGRLSFELVHKARRAGIPVLVAIGAPSSLAIDIALEHGLTLVGFAKNNNMTVYSGRGRISH